jgi:hypothetical protein
MPPIPMPDASQYTSNGSSEELLQSEKSFFTLWAPFELGFLF